MCLCEPSRQQFLDSSNSSNILISCEKRKRSIHDSIPSKQKSVLPTKESERWRGFELEGKECEWERKRERIFNTKTFWKFSSDDWWRFLWKHIPKMEQRLRNERSEKKYLVKRREKDEERERQEAWIVWSGRIKTTILFKRDSSQDGITIVLNSKFLRIILFKIYWLPSSQNYTEFYWMK